MTRTGPEGFYVTVRRQVANGVNTGLLLGPYPTKDEADGRVAVGRRLANEVDSWTAFDAFGVTRVVMKPGAELPAGKLNELLSIEEDPADA